MKKWNQFKKMSLYAKVGVIGSVCSIIGLLIYFIPNANRSPKEINVSSGDQSPVVTNNNGVVNFDYSTKLKVKGALSSTQPFKQEPEYVTYSDDWELGKFNTTITAHTGGNKYIVIDKKEACLDVVSQRDFDDNGTTDALVMNINACGGNAVGNSFFFISYKGSGHFQITEIFGNTWAVPMFEKWNGIISVMLVQNNEGFNIDDAEEHVFRYILNSGKYLLVEESKRMKLIVLAELKASDFDYNKNETLSLTHDLDGDGVNDEVSGSLWHRWGRIQWNVRLSRYGLVGGNIACKRIGVLSNITNGVNDLVCDQDEILKYSDGEYK